MKIKIAFDIPKCGPECQFFKWKKPRSICSKGNFEFTNYSGDFPDECPFLIEKKDEYRGC